MINYRALRIAILNFTGFRSNWGCQATSWGMIELLNKYLDVALAPTLALVPLLPRHVIDQKIEQSSLSDIHDAMMDVCHNGQAAGKSIAYLERLVIQRFGKHAAHTRASDIVFLQAEGTMAGTDFLRGTRLLLLPFVAKHAWKKPVIAMNQTIYSCDDEFSQILAATYNSFDLVAVRENISFDAANAAGIRQPLLIPDAAFLTRPQKGPADPPCGKHFAVTGTAWYGDDTHEQIFAAADRLKQESGLAPIITVSTNEDQKIHALALKHWGERGFAIIPPNIPFWAAARALQQSRFLLSGRYHMSIMAMVGGTPVIQLPGNSYKNEGLSAMMGGLSSVRQFDDLAAIGAEAAEILAHPEQTAAALQSALQPIKERLQISAEYFAAVQNGHSPQIPELLLHPPGHPVSAKSHLPAYCPNTVKRAETFTYSDKQQALLGPEPVPRAIFGALFRAYKGGDKAVKNSLAQVLRSFPGKVEAAQPAFRNQIYSLPLAFLAMAGVPRPPDAEESISSLQDLRRLCGENIAWMKHAVIPGSSPTAPRPQAKNLAVHLATLRDEFATKSELLFYHAALICLLRREIETSGAFACFNELWAEEPEYLLRELDGRWLISACDTFADHAHDALVRSVAMTGSVLGNTVKLYETENWAMGKNGADPCYRAVTLKAQLHDGNTAFRVGSGDMVHNLRDRLAATTKTDHVVSKIVSELFRRLHLHDTVFRRFRNMQIKEPLRWKTEL